MSFKTLLVSFVTSTLLSHSLFASPIVKSANDSRQYQSLVLENQMQVLLISDPDTLKAAASLNVEVGSTSNPESRPGLAHFLEHMLFLGTEKYPDANEYSSFINSHGGSQNAFTSPHNTNYFFDIKADALEPGLDRFAQFFISPLFSEKYTQRELNAVHSEYQSKLRDDVQRNYSAFKQVMNQNHPESNFAVGSLATLADNEHSKIRDDLISFYNQYYSANQMSLVVLGRQPLNVLKELVIEKFSAVKNLHTKAQSINLKRIEPSQLPFKLNVKTLKDYRHLKLTFPTPPAKQYYKEKPLSYLASLIGYEGKGSLISYLKSLGYINALSASVDHQANVESNLQVSFSLTKQGFAHQDEIIGYFFSFINELKKEGANPDLFEEMKQLSDQAFEFLPTPDPTGYVVNLAQKIRHFPEEYWLNAGYLLETFNEKRINHFLTFIHAENMYVNLQTPSVETDSTAPYFTAEYSIEKFDDQTISQWENALPVNELFVRELNPYIASNLSIKADPEQINQSEKTIAPQKYTLQEGVSLWHLQDTEFLTPKANLFFTFRLSDRTLTTKEQLTLSLFVRLVNDHFNELFYDAASAGIYLNLYPHSRGISLRISGYNEKQPLIIKQLPRLADIRFRADRFDILKGNYLRSLSNRLQEKPYQQLIENISNMVTGSDSILTKTDILNAITIEDIYSLTEYLFSKGEVKVLSHGNISLPEAKEQTTNIILQLGVLTTQTGQDITQVIRLPTGDPLHLFKEIDNTDSAVALYLQGKNTEPQERVAVSLLTEMIATRYSNQLRTEQQLGYLVFASNMTIQKLPAIIFIVQSPDASPEAIMSSNNNFLQDARNYIDSMEDSELQKFKRSLISRYEEKVNSIYTRSNQLWSVINSKNQQFNEQEILIETTKNMTSADLLNSWDKLKQRQLVSVSYSHSIEDKPLMEKNRLSAPLLLKFKKEQLNK